MIKVNGVQISESFTSCMAAELAKNNMPDEQRSLAEVVPVTTDGKTLLLV